MSKSPCSLTRNMTSHSMENLTLHSLLRWKVIILYKFSLHHSYNCFLYSWENTLFELRTERVNACWMCVLTIYSFLHFRTETFFSVPTSITFCPRAWSSFRAGCLSVGVSSFSVPSVLCPACFSWHYYFSSHSRFPVHKSLAPLLFGPGLTSNWISFVFLALPLFSNWISLFRAPVPGLLQRVCFVLPRGFLCFPIDFLLFRALVPGLLPWALFCLAQRYPLHSHPHSLVSRDIFLCLMLHFVLSCRSHSLTAFCCLPSPNNRMRMKPRVCLLSC